MRMKDALPLGALIAVLSFVGAAIGQQSGSAADAKALLARAVPVVKADKATALARFEDPNGGFKDRDLYVFCFDRASGTNLVGPLKGRDIKAVKDATGEAFGQEMFDKAKEGDVIAIDYMFPRPGTTMPVPKESFIEAIGDVVCGVGYYK